MCPFITVTDINWLFGLKNRGSELPDIGTGTNDQNKIGIEYQPKPDCNFTKHVGSAIISQQLISTKIDKINKLVKVE